MCHDNGSQNHRSRSEANAQAKQDKLYAQAINEAARQVKVRAREGAATVADAPAEASTKAPSEIRKRVATMNTCMHYCLMYMCVYICILIVLLNILRHYCQRFVLLGCVE
jgi:hypothetical protein